MKRVRTIFIYMEGNTESTIRDIIKEQLDYTNEIKDTDYLKKDLGADSLDIVEIELKIERAFGVHIDCINYEFEDPTVEYYVNEVRRALEK